MTNPIPTIWAKTDIQHPDPERWLPLTAHLNDTKAVAELIWDHWLPTHVKTLLAHDIGDPKQAKNTYLFLAATHDIGKASPAFATYIAHNPTYEHLIQRMRDNGLVIPNSVIGNPHRADYRHELVGYAALCQWLQDHQCDPTTANTYAAVTGGHHGSGLSDQAEQRIWNQGLYNKYCGGNCFINARNTIIDTQAADTHFTTPTRPLTRRAQTLLTALIIMADWIASDQTLFPLTGNHPTNPHQRAQNAWNTLQLPAPWTPTPENPDTLFQQRFHLTPRPFQQTVIHTAQTMTKPGIITIEAPMGDGKTEAALTAAEILCQRFNMGGTYIALPTQATANAMLNRLTNWITTLPTNNQPNTASLFLAHGKNQFNPTYTHLPAWTNTNVDNGHQQPVANIWLRGRKRGNLSNFVVSTIDQILATSLKTKHLVLRHLALAGKVVILDEVHACDAYMGEYLERSLEWLGMYEVPVILMSATLTSEKRHALIDAYERGRGDATPEMDEPVATPVVSTAGERLMPRSSARSADLTIRLFDDGDLETTVREAYTAGAKTVIIRDTVRRAMETRERLTSIGLPVILDHSRYTAEDRSMHDRQAMRALSPDSDEPAIVVGTQVLEQSLDIDADLMISDIAPMDLLLQRSGRLHRHAHRRPKGYETPLLLLDGVSIQGDSLEFGRGITNVYPKWPLMRTLSTLGLNSTHRESIVHLPQDLARMTENAYRTNTTPEWGSETIALEDWNRSISEKQSNANTLSMLPSPTDNRPANPRMEGWFTTGRDSDIEETGGVRESSDNIEIVLLEKRDGQLYPFGDDTPIPHSATDIDRGEMIRVLSRTINITPYMTGGIPLIDFLNEIDSTAPEQWRAITETGPLKGHSAMVLENGRHTMNKTTVTYDSEKGWNTAS